MDLAKIITDLKMELQRLDAAINSMEDLARVQNSPNGGEGIPLSAERSQDLEKSMPAKRRRGRPRKKHVPSNEAVPQAMSAGVSGGPASGDATTTAA